MHFDNGVPYEEAARKISLDRFAGWLDPERIIINVASLYRQFSGPTAAAVDRVALFAGMKRYRDATPFERIRVAKSFSKALPHPSIADKAWSAIMRGDLDEAVRTSFIAVEVAVRDAGKFSASDLGVDLMRKAFQPDKGPLTRNSNPPAEREGLMHLFAGAILSCKNPHSHRFVKLSDPREAWEQVMLATHLFRHRRFSTAVIELLSDMVSPGIPSQNF